MRFLYYKHFSATHCGRGKVGRGWRLARGHRGHTKLNKLGSPPLGSDRRWALQVRTSSVVGRSTYFRMDGDSDPLPRHPSNDARHHRRTLDAAVVAIRHNRRARRLQVPLCGSPDQLGDGEDWGDRPVHFGAVDQRIVWLVSVLVLAAHDAVHTASPPLSRPRGHLWPEPCVQYPRERFAYSRVQSSSSV